MRRLPNPARGSRQSMTRQQAWLLLLPVVLLAGFASAMAGGCAPTAPMLTLEKNDSPDPVNTNGQITYTIDVSNDGSGRATNVQLVDNLPAGTTFVSAMAAQGNCVPAGLAVTCQLGDIPVGMSVQVTITVAAPGSAGQISNTATASSAEMATDQDTEITDVVAPTPPVDLQTSVTSTTQGVVHNGPAIATFEVQNLDNSTAANGVVATGTLPAGATLNAAASSPTVTVKGNVVTATMGMVAANASASVTVAVDFAAATGGAQFTMTAAHSGPDNNSGNDAARATLDARDPQTDIVASPCTATSLTGDPQDPFDVDCPYANNGSENVVLDFDCSNDADVLLQGLSNSSGTACTAGANGGQCTGVFVPAGGQVTLHQDIEPQTPGANEAGSCSASGLYSDTALGDETGAYNYIVDEADLQLTDSCPGCSGGFVAGTPFTVTYNEINLGDAIAPGAEFRCQASAGLLIDNIQPSEGACTGAPGTSGSCLYDSDVNEAHTWVVTAHGLAGFSGQESLDCETVHPYDIDPTGSAVSTALLLRDPVTDLSCGCTSSCSGIDPENTCTVSCSCSNLGTETIADAQLVCPFSQDVTLESQTCDRGLCSDLNETLDWDLALGPGETGTVDMTLNTGAGAAGTAQNFQCNSTFTGTDTDLLNDDPSILVDVDEADLQINGQCLDCAANIGEMGELILDVSNLGDAPANLGRVTCTSPTGFVRFDSAITADGGETCSGLASDTASCDDSIGEGETERYTIRFTPLAGAQPQESFTCTAVDPFDPTPAAPFSAVVTVTQPTADKDWTGFTESANPLIFGDDETYAFTTINRGPDDEPALVADFDFANGDVLVASFPGGLCTIVDIPTGDQVTCARGLLAVNDTETFTVVARAIAVAPIDVTATLTGGSNDPDPQDVLIFSTPVNPAPAPNLAVTGACNNCPAEVGGTVSLRYTVMETNGFGAPLGTFSCTFSADLDNLVVTGPGCSGGSSCTHD
jgi:uncharacterized repeat protein (TIGR01451 family)